MDKKEEGYYCCNRCEEEFSKEEMLREFVVAYCPQCRTDSVEYHKGENEELDE